jgi:hypothetical protein
VEPVLDLDVAPEAGVAKRWTKARLGALPVAIAVLVGMAVAAAGTHIFEDRRRAAREASEVSLTALVAGSSSSGGGDSRILTLEGHLAVANSGPLPVVVENATGSVGGLTFSSTAERTVRPGVVQIPVTVTIECAAGIPVAAIESVLRVRTADGQVRAASSLMIVAGTSWAHSYEQMCPATQ